MKIAQVIGRYTGGGAGRSSLNLAIGLKEIGIGSVCIALRDGGGYVDLERSRLPVFALKAHEGHRAAIRSAIQLRKLIRSESIDVLHAHAPASLIFITLATLGMRPRPQLCFTWHDPVNVLEERGLSDHPLVLSMRRADTLYCCSDEIRSRLTRTFGGPYHKDLVLLHNGVPETSASQEVASDNPTIVWAARVNPLKDPQILLRVCQRLMGEGLRFRLVFAGDAPPHAQEFVKQTRAMISDLGLQDRTEWLGWQHDLLPVYARSAIGVQTSHAEGLSMTLLEQMMAGLAIVATDVGGTKEAMLHEKTGLLIPPSDEEALELALRRLICDPELRIRFATVARARAQSEFSLGSMAKRMLAGLRAKNMVHPALPWVW